MSYLMSQGFFFLPESTVFFYFYSLSCQDRTSVDTQLARYLFDYKH